MAKIYVGMDIGCSLNKLCLVATQPIEIPLFTYDTCWLQQTQLHIYTKGLPMIQDFLALIQKQLVPIAYKLTIALTGGGALKYSQHIQKLMPDNKFHILNEFDSHVRGLQFLRKAKVVVHVEEFSNPHEGEVTQISKEMQFSQLNQTFLFVSLGTGVNFQKIGLGENGLQRKKADDPSTVVGDGYFLGGTCLGAGFLMGLGRLISGDKDYSQLLSRMREEQQMNEIYNIIVTNLMQISINLSVIHQTSNIFITGSLLVYSKSIAKQFKQALQLNLSGIPLNRRVVTVMKFDGFLGALGALTTQLLSQL